MPESAPLDRLRAIMARLRDPDEGCPWDVQQSFETIAPYTIEEAYEVADAIARGDHGELCGELGDLLLQVVFHSRIAEEAGLFTFDDVAAAIADKMVRRHPHVFAGQSADNFDWEASKAAERAKKDEKGALAGIAIALPALLRAQKLQKRAARVGFDWPDVTGPKDKIREEFAEFEAAETTADREEEAGDLLFAVVNYLRKSGIEPESALRAANRKFETRFSAMEALAARSERSFAQLSLEEQERLWLKVKYDE